MGLRRGTKPSVIEGTWPAPHQATGQLDTTIFQQIYFRSLQRLELVTGDQEFMSCLEPRAGLLFFRL